MILPIICIASIVSLCLLILIIPQKRLDKIVYWFLKNTNQLSNPMYSADIFEDILLSTEQSEKPKREFVEHDGELLEVVDYEKPKRGNDGSY